MAAQADTKLPPGWAIHTDSDQATHYSGATPEEAMERQKHLEGCLGPHLIAIAKFAGIHASAGDALSLGLLAGYFKMIIDDAFTGLEGVMGLRSKDDEK
jgi:hypothetical protein